LEIDSDDVNTIIWTSDEAFVQFDGYASVHRYAKFDIRLSAGDDDDLKLWIYSLKLPKANECVEFLAGLEDTPFKESAFVGTFHKEIALIMLWH
jgi:hypothetical protein